jgi:hypothetical protein
MLGKRGEGWSFRQSKSPNAKGSRMRKQKKIWIGIGAFVVAGTTAAAAPGPLNYQDGRAAARATASADIRGQTLPASSFTVAQHSNHGGEGGEGEGGERARSGGEGEGGERSKSGGEGEGGERSKSGGEGEGGEGEGGEGGEGGGRSLAPDMSFAVRIAQMRGHLLVGDQLIKEGQWAAAMPHFLHPAEELYDGVRGQLKTYKTPPFEAELTTLANLVKRKKGGKDYDKAFKAVQDAFAAADAGVKARQSNWPSFAVATSLELVKSAAGEYEEAIEKGRIAKPVEYQDARGFILQSEKMFESVAPSLEKKDASAVNSAREAFADLKKIFPTATPPKEPVKDYGSMLGEVSRFELASSRLM